MLCSMGGEPMIASNYRNKKIRNPFVDERDTLYHPVFDKII